MKTQCQASRQTERRISKRSNRRFLQRTLAGALVQTGILFSSVSSEKRSSAAAINEPSTVTVAEFIVAFFTSFFTGGTAEVDVDVDEETAALEAAGAGVPARLGSALTVKSLP